MVTHSQPKPPTVAHSHPQPPMVTHDRAQRAHTMPSDRPRFGHHFVKWCFLSHAEH